MPLTQKIFYLEFYRTNFLNSTQFWAVILIIQFPRKRKTENLKKEKLTQFRPETSIRPAPARAVRKLKQRRSGPNLA
jgi:hypothetical protein